MNHRTFFLMIGLLLSSLQPAFGMKIRDEKLSRSCYEELTTEAAALAIKTGDTKLLDACLEDGVTDKEIAIFAVETGDIDVLHTCFEIGVDVNTGIGWYGVGTFLDVAVKQGNEVIVRYLICRGVKVDLDTLKYAIRNDLTEIARLLVPRLTDVNEVGYGEGNACLHIALECNNVVVAEALLNAGAQNSFNHNGLTPLHIAASRGFLQVVQKIINDLNGDCNLRERRPATYAPAPVQGQFFGATPLHCAVSGGHVETVIYLLEAGADPHLCVGNWRGHKTSLQEAVRWGESVAVVRVLIEREIEHFVFVNAPLNDNGLTLLHCAAKNDNPSAAFIIRILVFYGANVNAELVDGDDRKTPLHITAGDEYMNIKAMEALINCGANIHAKTRDGDDGETPLEHIENGIEDETHEPIYYAIDEDDDRESEPLRPIDYVRAFKKQVFAKKFQKHTQRKRKGTNGCGGRFIDVIIIIRDERL